MDDSRQSPKVLVEDTPEEATAVAAELVKSIICESAHIRHACHIALSGGTTPRALYQHLTATCASGEVPWSEVEVFFGDERDVSHDDIASNYGMVQRTLLDHVPVPPFRVHPMGGDSPDLESAAAEYEKTICRAIGGQSGAIPQFDLILLGMGGDGHVASLYPETSAITESDRLVVSQFIPVLGRNRMTFTYPLINAARNVLLLITGEDKAEAVSRLLSDDPAARKKLPAAGIEPAGTFMIILDAAAAKRAQQKTV